MSLSGLFNPPEQAGYLMKLGHGRKSWQERFFVLKGSSLFYFKDRKAPHKANKIDGFIPLEAAKVETELPPGMAGVAHLKGSQHFITITVHSSFAFSCDHPFYVLAAPSQEVQMAWVNACWQAAIPRTDLIQVLEKAGKLADVLGSYAHGVQANFPVADAAVLSSGGRARTAAAANKNAALAPDVAALPMVVSDKPAPASMLARTTSGNVISAPTESVMHAARSWDGEVSVPQRAASASLASSGTPFRTKAPPSSTPGPAPSGGATTQGSAIGASPLSPAKQATGGVALTATATSQAADSSSRAAASAKEKAAAAEQAKALQQQISKLEKQAAEAGAKQGGNAGTATAGARP
ncbi:hypothetical protein COHA_004497 [Chlorella ohadii]|uniref:PH domain-containing protein n=1 Tax=Chlorella ohadii TaxID=2649997 RepID=A0AAD5H6H5_9CHLO|nr:hypothetical protein COHA_004497 [Chlorella ohadii]